MSSTMTKNNRSNAPSVPTARDPFSAMREEMNDLISRIWYGNDGQGAGLPVTAAMDVSEDDNSYEIHVDAPGMKSDDFDIQVQGNLVTLSGKREEKTEEKDKTFHRVERRSGSFSRSVTLPCDINEDEVVAEYDDGVLKIVLPKAENSRAKRISVRS